MDDGEEVVGWVMGRSGRMGGGEKVVGWLMGRRG